MIHASSNAMGGSPLIIKSKLRHSRNGIANSEELSRYNGDDNGIPER